MFKHIPEYGPIRSKADARSRAEALIERLECRHPAEDSGGINVEAIAEKLGVRVIDAPGTNPKLSGAFLLNDGEPTLLYNREHSRGRQRFTIAHELAHFLFHSHGERKVFFRDDESTKGIHIREIQANAFAAALLMPEKFMRESVPQPIPMHDSETVDKLARTYNVSSHAMSIRLSDLGLLAAG